MSKSIDNLRNAFSGESEANRRYLAFAQKAEEEGLTQVAKLFRATAEAETIHALNHLNVIGEVKSTSENLHAAIAGENFEFKKMYPEFVSLAIQEGNKKATQTFDYARRVEQVHANLFLDVVEKLKNQENLKQVDYYVCSVCGNTVENKPPFMCPICGSRKKKFFKIA